MSAVDTCSRRPLCKLQRKLRKISLKIFLIEIRLTNTAIRDLSFRLFTNFQINF